MKLLEKYLQRLQEISPGVVKGLAAGISIGSAAIATRQMLKDQNMIKLQAAYKKCPTDECRKQVKKVINKYLSSHLRVL